MPLARKNTKTFHRRLYAGQLETVTLLKGGDDMREGEVVSHKLFQCRRSIIVRTGEPINKEVASGSRTVWHIPKSELKRVGVDYITVLDRVVSFEGTWMPEAQQNIFVKLFGNWVTFECVCLEPA